MTNITTAKLKKILATAETNVLGNTANYIPELANVPEDLLAITIQAIGDKPHTISNLEIPKMTLQSTSKLIPLIGLLEEQGASTVFSWVKVEPSGDDFASVARLDQFGPKASNPMLNAGAITLCSHIPGEGETRLAWLHNWVSKLYGVDLNINNLVLTSERRTGDRNRSLAYLLKSQGNIDESVEETLELYFSLCSYEAFPEQLIGLPYLLANDGINAEGQRVISSETVKYTLAIMATCGLYNESGTHMVRTGMPAKSGVSGIILAVSPGKGAVVVASPKVNSKGNSIRGSIVLEQISNQFKWHFADPK
jgi:glutaminase